MDNLKKGLKKAPFAFFSALIFLLALGFLGWQIVRLIQADEIGATIGSQAGSLVGMAVGSYHGITDGISAGTQEGHDAGIASDDVQATVSNEISKVGKLDVLAAGVRLKDVLSIGEDYKALYLLKGSIVFSLDLSQASVDAKDSELKIFLPKPEMELYIDETATEKLAEYQAHSWTGNAHDGYTAYLNSRDKTEDEIKKSLVNYDTLMAQAKEASKNQVKELARAICGSDKTISVYFNDEG